MTLARNPVVIPDPAPHPLSAAARSASRWRQAVLYDLDSSVADTRQRRYLCPLFNPESSWTDYAMACAHDEPMQASILVLRAFAALGHSCHAVSARPIAAEALTSVWLSQHDVPCHSLRLRQPSDPEDSGEFKLSVVGEFAAGGYEPYLFLEDLPSVVRLLSAVVPVLAVNPLYSDAVSSQFEDPVRPDGR